MQFPNKGAGQDTQSWTRPPTPPPSGLAPSPVRVGDKTVMVSPDPPVRYREEAITKDELRRQRESGHLEEVAMNQRNPMNPSSQPIPDHGELNSMPDPSLDGPVDRMGKLEGDIQELTKAVGAVVEYLSREGSGESPPVTQSSPSVEDTPCEIQESPEPTNGTTSIPPEAPPQPTDPGLEVMQKRVRGWLNSKDLVRGFRSATGNLHKRLRYDEWPAAFREAFNQKFEEFVGNDDFVQRIVRVVRSFPDGKVVADDGLGSFCAVLAGYLSMFVAFSHVEEQLNQ